MTGKRESAAALAAVGRAEFAGRPARPGAGSTIARPPGRRAACAGGRLDGGHARIAQVALPRPVFRRRSIGKMGIDFFQIPRGFNNLLAGNSVMLTEVGDYGPYATPYLNHPLVAVAIGSWASVFSPWAGYAAFVAVSLGLMFFGRTGAGLRVRHRREPRFRLRRRVLLAAGVPDVVGRAGRTSCSCWPWR